MPAKKITVLDFTATWCQPCQKLKPHLHKLAEANPNIKLIEVDVESRKPALKALVHKHKVQAVPTLIWVVGGKVVHDSRDGGNAGDPRGLAGLGKLAEKLST